MNLYEAVYERFSVRKYRKEPVEGPIIAGALKYIEEMDTPFPDIRVQFRVIDAWNQKPKFSGIANVSAPHYIAVYVEEKEKSQMKAGYMMQALALYFTERGVGSCYQGMTKMKDEQLAQEELHCVMVMAFGYPKGKAFRHKKEAKRLTMEALCAFKDAPKPQILELLDAARLAPSPFNSQPWRFVVYDNRIHIFSKKSVGLGYYLNKTNEFTFGILLANMLGVADDLWIDVELIKLDNITHINLPNNQYVVSLLLR